MFPELWWQEGTPPVSIRLHPIKSSYLSDYKDVVPWCPTGRYLLERPVFTLDPHFHAGAYYVQEASSMFLAQLTSLFKEGGINRVLDLCAAPGGKSTLLAELLPQNGILVANEVIRSRVGPLCENMAKWGYANVLVTNNRVEDFNSLPHYFDLVLVDAPCSGEGMFRKNPELKKEWSAETVAFCAQRQRRIVADVWETLRPDGYLIYCTCTFNRLENEENVAWICTHLGAEKCAIQIDSTWGVLEQEGCYRFNPNQLKGEGFFFALLQKKSVRRGGLHPPIAEGKKGKKGKVNREAWVGREWVREGYDLFTKGGLLKALPAAIALEMLTLEALLHGVQGGVAVARIKGSDWIPEADLALSTMIHPNAFPIQEVDISMAKSYLAREVLVLKDAPYGYVLIQYNGSRLGFAKNITHRINNLHPPARRIRMGI